MALRVHDNSAKTIMSQSEDPVGFLYRLYCNLEATEKELKVFGKNNRVTAYQKEDVGEFQEKDLRAVVEKTKAEAVILSVSFANEDIHDLILVTNKDNNKVIATFRGSAETDDILKRLKEFADKENEGNVNRSEET